MNKTFSSLINKCVWFRFLYFTGIFILSDCKICLFVKYISNKKKLRSYQLRKENSD